MTALPRCNTCNVYVRSPVIVPPYYDETSFRCVDCVTPAEQVRIDDYARRLRNACISWERIHEELGDVRFAEFERWMAGQTWSIEHGVYRSDYNRFLANLPIID